jgi:hypothetical protein
VIRLVTYPPVDDFDPFSAEQDSLFARDVRDEPSVGAHDPPPRNIFHA